MHCLLLVGMLRFPKFYVAVNVVVRAITPCYRPRSRGDNTFGSVHVCVCVRPFVLGHSSV